MVGDDSFKDWLKRQRKALDLTQAELAHKAGCSIYTIQKIEEGGARPSRHWLSRPLPCLRRSLPTASRERGRKPARPQYRRHEAENRDFGAE